MGSIYTFHIFYEGVSCFKIVTNRGTEPVKVGGAVAVEGLRVDFMITGLKGGDN